VSTEEIKVGGRRRQKIKSMDERTNEAMPAANSAPFNFAGAGAIRLQLLKNFNPLSKRQTSQYR
jgi:hypothetical protein